ncbi:hypothetical protein ACFSTC_39755 [Nonomuraea ferruginea]
MRAWQEYDHVSYVRRVALMICLPWTVGPTVNWKNERLVCEVLIFPTRAMSLALR